MLRNRIFYITLLLVALASCGEQAQLADFCEISPPIKIISGQECTKTTGPVIKLSILDEEDNERICSGTLISPDTVLTALHCFDENTFGVFAIVEGVQVPLKKLTLHPAPVELPGGIFINDLALAQFESDLGNEFVTRLATEPIQAGQKIEIFGFGWSVGGDSLSGGALRRGEMLISNVDPNFISANFTGNGQNTCFGDSGGPAFIETKDGPALVGVIAYGLRDDCGPGDTSTFVNLQSPAVIDFLKLNGLSPE